MRLFGVLRFPPILLSAALTLGACEAVEEKLGLKDPPKVDAAEADAEKLDVGGQDDGEESQDDGKRKKRKRRKAKAKPAPPPPPPEAELDAALVRAIVPVEDGLWRIDPFVLTLVADTLARGEDQLPFSRISPKERKEGAPPSFRVGELPTPSMWRLLGLLPGDLVMSIEDVQPPGPRGLVLLRKQLPVEGTLTVKVQREGSVKELRYRIEPGLAWTRYLEIEAGRTFAKPPERGGSGGGGGGSSGSGKSSGSSSSSKSPSKPTEVPVKCSGNTCRVPKWYVDSLVRSSSKAKQQMRGSSIGSGFKVTFVGPASRKAGFAVGDVITRVNGRRTNNQLDMLALYGGLQSTKKYAVEFTRGGSKRSKTILVEG